MKRMNEVFSLPLKRGVDDSVVESNDAYVGDFWTGGAAVYAIHAINNVDALADALEKLIPYWFGGNEESIDAMVAAKDALAAYRGAK